MICTLHPDLLCLGSFGERLGLSQHSFLCTLVPSPCSTSCRIDNVSEQYESRGGDTMADTPPIRNYNPWATSTLRRYWFALGLGSFLYSLYHLTYNYLVSVLVPPPPPAAGAQTYTLHWSFFE
uniref:Uncharacterized protein n=1 Tax=Homalodisca liturata TaxID=320908 RepID=A0A1B6H711_9HEMI